MKGSDANFLKFLCESYKKSLVQNKNGYDQDLFKIIYNIIYPSLVKQATFGKKSFEVILELTPIIEHELKNAQCQENLLEMFQKLLNEEIETIELLCRYFLGYTGLNITVHYDFDIEKKVVSFSWK